MAWSKRSNLSFMNGLTLKYVGRHAQIFIATKINQAQNMGGFTPCVATNLQMA